MCYWIKKDRIEAAPAPPHLIPGWEDVETIAKHDLGFEELSVDEDDKETRYTYQN